MTQLVEKYRPDQFDEIEGQDENIKEIKKLSESGDIPHFMFLGPPGTGKTTAAYCVCRALFGEAWERHVAIFNASSTRGIDTVRGPITRLVKMTGKRIVFLDEFDNVTPDGQECMRGLMDIASKRDVRFILTGNYDDDIIHAIKSRCTIYRFKRLDKRPMTKRLINILLKEGVSKDEIRENRDKLEELVKESNGDLRKAIGLLVITKDKQLDIKARTDDLSGVEQALLAALGDDFDKAQQMIEAAYVTNRFSADKIITRLEIAIKENISDKKIKIRLFHEISKVAIRCKQSHTPTHLVSFLAYVWMVKYLPSNCPIIESD